MSGDEIKIIDIDVHNALKSPRDLQPYLPDSWKTHIAESGLGIPGLGYYNPLGFSRQDSKPPSGAPAASDPDFVIDHYIEPNLVEYAVLTGDLIGVSSMHDPDRGAVVASAYNDYIAGHWLAKHPQYRGLILVSATDPMLAAAEIDRLAGHPGFVGVLLSSAQRAPLGQRQYHPIYEAAHRHGLPISIHSGAEGTGGTNAPTTSGHPTRYLEWHTALSQTYMAHMTSLVCEGVFEKFPSLKFVFLESGISWLPHLIWRLDKNYKGLRSSVPWLKRLPGEYIRDHFLFSTQPVEEPDDPEHLISIFDMIDAENILMFASDYPHWDSDAPSGILKKLRPEARRKIVYENAKTLYQL